MYVLGIMNGTSGDGIDFVLTEINFKKKQPLRFIQHFHKAFDKSFREQTKKLITNQATTYEVGEYHHQLGRLYQQSFSELRWKHKPELIGLHGQTVYHRGGFATLQLGEPSYLAQKAKCPVLFNFRANDIALGGEGAPLAPVLHKYLLSHLKDPVAFHNLGGISNLTYCFKKTWLAFDTGPANTLLDIWIQQKSRGKLFFDDSGQTAAQGLPDQESLKKLLTSPYFKKPAPKSCGREDFNLDFIHQFVVRKFHKLPLADQLATLTELSALSIFEAYQNLVPQKPHQIFFSGGGLKNLYLMQRLKMYLGADVVKSSEDLGWPSPSIEGAAFALLAYLRWNQERLHLQSVTGSRGAALLGQICEP